VLLVASCYGDLFAQRGKSNNVSVAFGEFLKREGVRDTETGAILRVRPKQERFTDNFPLDCSIRPLPVTNDVRQFEIVLTVHSRTGNEVHERLVFDSEPALLTEVARQTRFTQLAPERERRVRDTQTRKIASMTGGTLKYGLTREQVAEVRGKNWKHGNQMQKGGAFEMCYEDMTFFFDPVLVDLWPAGQAPLGDLAPKPVPLNSLRK